MKAASLSEISAYFYQTIRHYVPKDIGLEKKTN